MVEVIVVMAIAVAGHSGQIEVVRYSLGGTSQARIGIPRRGESSDRVSQTSLCSARSIQPRWPVTSFLGSIHLPCTWSPSGSSLLFRQVRASIVAFPAAARSERAGCVASALQGVSRALRPADLVYLVSRGGSSINCEPRTHSSGI